MSCVNRIRCSMLDNIHRQIREYENRTFSKCSFECTIFFALSRAESELRQCSIFNFVALMDAAREALPLDYAIILKVGSELVSRGCNMVY